jgi:hypothetical protein
LLNATQVASVLPGAVAPTSTLGADLVIDGIDGESACEWAEGSMSLTVVVDDVTAERLAAYRPKILDNPLTAGLGDIGGVLTASNATEALFEVKSSVVALTLQEPVQDTKPTESAMVALGKVIAAEL